MAPAAVPITGVTSRRQSRGSGYRGAGSNSWALTGTRRYASGASGAMPGCVGAAVTEPGCGCHARLALGAYLLGGLAAAEADAVRRHLASCLPCRAEYDQLACLPSWLSLVSADNFRRVSPAAEGTETAHDPGGDKESDDDPPA
jgi:hypothetical protein